MSYSRRVFLFFVFFLLLCSAGRLNAGDAVDQLQVTTLFVTSGKLWTTEKLGDRWFRGREGQYYEYHDIGQIGVMLPSAAVGAALSTASTYQKILIPSAIARVLVSFTYALLSALGAWTMFRLFACFYPERTAFLVTLVFAMGTIYFPYAKSAFDVQAASVFVILTLYFSTRLGLAEQWTGGALLSLSLSLSAACLMRASLAPFVLIGAALFLLSYRTRWRVKEMLLSVIPLVASLLLIAWYNYYRTGSPMQTGAVGEGSFRTAVSPNLLHGLYGLLLSPNRGLLLHAPVFILLAAVPFLWRGWTREQRTLCLSYGIGALAYTLLISSLSFWGTFGWGPRYLIPVLPILFLGVGMALPALYKLSAGRYRFGMTALILLSVTLNAAPVLVSWSRLPERYLVSKPSVYDPDAALPLQQLGVWEMLGKSVSGNLGEDAIPVSRLEIAGVPAVIPDFWTVYLIRYGGAAALVGGTCLIGLTLVSGFLLTVLLKRP